MAIYEKWNTIKYGTVTVGKDDTGHDVKFFGATSGKYLLWDESADSLSLVAKLVIAETWATAGATGRPLEVDLTTTVALGSYVNAIKGYVNLSTGGSSSGLFSVFNGEMNMAATAGLPGHYAIYEAEITCPTSWAGTNDVFYFWLQSSGNTKANFDTYGNLLNLKGLASGSGKMLYGSTIRLQVEDVAKYILLSTAENALTTDVVITTTNATASTTTATGALIVSGGVGIAKGLFVGEVVSVGTVCQPDASDGAALGTTALQWSDLFLASTGVINWANGNVTITHATGALACTGALTLSIATASSSTTTGGLIVTGGVGIGGAIYVGGLIDGVGKLTQTRTNPTAAENGIYALTNSGGATGWTGTVTPIRGHQIVTNTGTLIGNSYGGWFGLRFATGMTADRGGLSVGLYAESDSQIATRCPNSVAYFQSVVSAAGDQSAMPILVLTSTGGTNATKAGYAFSLGHGAAATTVGTGSGYMYYNNTIKILANGDTRYIPLSTAEGTYTTEYPISTSSTIASTSTIATTSAVTAAISVTATQTSATPGTIRGIYSKETTFTSMTSGNLTGVRGEIVTGGNVSGSYLYGVQGKITMGAHSLSTSGNMYCAVMGQMDISAGTLTSGSTACIIASVQDTTNTTRALNGIYVEFPAYGSGSMMSSVLRGFGGATTCLDFYNIIGGSFVTLSTTANSCASAYASTGTGAYSIKCTIQGVTTYIHTYDAA